MDLLITIVALLALVLIFILLIGVILFIILLIFNFLDRKIRNRFMKEVFKNPDFYKNFKEMEKENLDFKNELNKDGGDKNGRKETDRRESKDKGRKSIIKKRVGDNRNKESSSGGIRVPIPTDIKERKANKSNGTDSNSTELHKPTDL